jgi:hypothetical protein
MNREQKWLENATREDLYKRQIALIDKGGHLDRAMICCFGGTVLVALVMPFAVVAALFIIVIALSGACWFGYQAFKIQDPARGSQRLSKPRSQPRGV